MKKLLCAFSLVFSFNLIASDFTISVQGQPQGYYDGNNNQIGTIFELAAPAAKYLHTQWGDYTWNTVSGAYTLVPLYAQSGPSLGTGHLVFSDTACQNLVGVNVNAAWNYSSGILGLDDSGNKVKFVFSNPGTVAAKGITIGSVKIGNVGCQTNTGYFPSAAAAISDIQIIPVAIPANFFPLTLPLSIK